jgi:hypothetical protein
MASRRIGGHHHDDLLYPRFLNSNSCRHSPPALLLDIVGIDVMSLRLSGTRISVGEAAAVANPLRYRLEPIQPPEGESLSCVAVRVMTFRTFRWLTGRICCWVRCRLPVLSHLECKQSGWTCASFKSRRGFRWTYYDSNMQTSCCNSEHQPSTTIVEQSPYRLP